VCTKRFRGKFNAIQCAIVWNGFSDISTSPSSSSFSTPLPTAAAADCDTHTTYYIIIIILLLYSIVHAKYRQANSPDDRRQLRNMSIFQSRACEFVPTEETKIITLLLYAPNPKRSRKRCRIILYCILIMLLLSYYAFRF
jgi:hypothetical protein